METKEYERMCDDSGALDIASWYPGALIRALQSVGDGLKTWEPPE